MVSKSPHFCRSPALCHHNPFLEEHQHLNVQESYLHHRKSAAKISCTSLLCCSLARRGGSSSSSSEDTSPSLTPQLLLGSSSKRFLGEKDTRSGPHCRRQQLLMRKQENATMNIRKRRQQTTQFGWTLTWVIALCCERPAGKVGWG